MTEEKENCNFQQSYNVFGLDDKPCCYLYHKYCDEIDSCYFKRCKRLEQENKELGRKAFLAEQNVRTTAATFCEKDNKIIELEQENKKLKNIIKIHDSTKYDYYKLMKENEELKEEVKELDKMTGIFSVRLCNKYRSVLEEIREELCCGRTFYEGYFDRENLSRTDKAIKKINEVLNE